jgi:integrase
MSEHTLESWSRSLRADSYAARTISARLKVVRTVAARAGVTPADLQQQHVIDFLAGREYAPWSRRTYLQHLTAWGSWIGRPELTAGIRRPPVPLAHPDPVPEDDLQLLMRHLRDRPRERAWVALGAFAGLRAAEVARLQSGQIGAGTLRIAGKGGRVDTLPVSPVLDRALRPWAGNTGPLWPVAPQTVSHTVRRLAAGCGVRMRFHQLRHRFGTAVYRETHDLLLTQRLMRHASPESTAGYAALADEDARLAVDQIPGATPDKPPKE